MSMRDEDIAIVKAAVMDEAAFIRMTLSRKLRSDGTPWVKVVVRPVLIQGKRRMQFSFFDPRKDITKNHPVEKVDALLDQALAIPFGDIHIQSATGDLRVRVNRKGHSFLSRCKPSRQEPRTNLAHDRAKKRLLAADAADPFLREIGITSPDGRVRPGMHGKFAQMNEFLRVIEQTMPKLVSPRSPVTAGEAEAPSLPAKDGTAPGEERPLRIVDCGCGNAYLTFAACHFLRHKLGINVACVGIDANPELIERNRALAERLGWPGLEFRASRIAEFKPEAPPDVVLSLHACDTATDEAIAKGILWGSRVILAAPCCQHELHDQLKSLLWQPALRHGILKERLADILTDTFRALLLRIMGYRTDVIQFVDPEHTAKNLLIRAELGLKPGDSAPISEYRALKEYWGVTPAIEEMIGEGIQRLL